MENRKLFQKVEILCECCGKNLLEKDSMGIFVTWLANQKSSNGKDVYQPTVDEITPRRRTNIR